MNISGFFARVEDVTKRYRRVICVQIAVRPAPAISISKVSLEEIESYAKTE